MLREASYKEIGFVIEPTHQDNSMDHGDRVRTVILVTRTPTNSLTVLALSLPLLVSSLLTTVARLMVCVTPRCEQQPRRLARLTGGSKAGLSMPVTRAQ